jgi:hypothetical protein
MLHAFSTSLVKKIMGKETQNDVYVGTEEILQILSKMTSFTEWGGSSCTPLKPYFRSVSFNHRTCHSLFT